jgi:hypothetical protein
MHVVIGSLDLAVGAKATAVCTACNSTVRQAMSRGSLLEALQQPPADVVLLDLQSIVPDAAMVVEIRQQAASGCVVAAFGPHVQEARLQAARTAGCDYVWSRGQWERQLSTLLLSKDSRLSPRE